MRIKQDDKDRNVGKKNYYGGGDYSVIMDRDTLLETAPLVQGRIRDQRNEICAGYVEWAIFTQSVSDTFRAEEVADIIESKTDILFEEIQINSALQKLADEEIIEHKRGDTFVKSGSKEFERIDSLIEDCWNDFNGVLNEHRRDIDVHAIDTNIEPAFRSFFNKYVGILERETEVLEESHHDVLYTADVVDIIRDTAEENRVDKTDVFEECLTEFLQNPSQSLKEYVGTVYIAIVNSDLLSRQKTIELPEIPEDQKKIFFDSNVIQDLLCETDSEHPLIKNVVERSEELGFDLYYFPETVADLQRSIDGAIREMDGLRDSNYTTQTFNNQFVKDWHREFRREGTEWSDYRAGMQRWELEVETRYGITEYESDVNCPDEEFEYAQDIIDRIDSERYKDSKKPAVLNHDAHILAKTAILRSSVDGKHSIGPLLLSLDNSVTQASDYAYQEGDWKEGIAVPPRVWFNYLLTFTSAEIGNVEIGEVILNVSANISSQPTIEEYSKAVEEKAGLESGSADLLAKYLRYSTYSDEIERSLRHDDGRADEWAFKALSNEEAMEQFTEHKQQKKRIRQMGQKIQELEKENAKLRETNNGDTYVVGGDAEAHGGTADAEAASESIATATAESSAELQQDIDDFIDIYHENVPQQIQREVDLPPEDKSDLEEVREWINTVTTAIAVAEPSTAALTAVSKFGNQLVDEISQRL